MLEDTRFFIEIQPVPETRGKFNLLAYLVQWNRRVITCGTYGYGAIDEGAWTQDPFYPNGKEGKFNV